MKYSYNKKILLLLLAIHLYIGAFGQNIQYVSVPFLLATPDARSGGMGDASAAIGSDANAIYGNVARIAFSEKPIGLSISYSPWLQSLSSDVSMSYLSFYSKINREITIATAFKYFSMGKADLTDNNRGTLGTFNPKDLAIDMAIAKNFGDKFSLSILGRYVYSNLATGQTIAGQQINIAQGFSVDASAYYRQGMYLFNQATLWAFGTSLSNIGTKMSYLSDGTQRFQPMNLRMGTALTFLFDKKDLHHITFAFDANKLVVPFESSTDASVQSALFSSFSNTKGMAYSFGTEYWIQKTLALRLGYLQKSLELGKNKSISLGSGIRYNSIGFDFAYIIPIEQSGILANALRFSLMFDFDKGLYSAKR